MAFKPEVVVIRICAMTFDERQLSSRTRRPLNLDRVIKYINITKIINIIKMDIMRLMGYSLEEF